MIGHSTSAPSFADYQSFAKDRLSPGDEAKKARLEARLSELEKKMAEKAEGKSPADKAEKEALQSRDSEVRQHERAHLASAGSLAQGGMKLDYQMGPDGRSYAIGGSVNIDTSPAGTPEETIVKAQQIRAAAMAPADPSGADIKVVAQASQMEAEARAEIAKKAKDGTDEDEEDLDVSSLKELFAWEDGDETVSEAGDDRGENSLMTRVTQGYGIGDGVNSSKANILKAFA